MGFQQMQTLDKEASSFKSGASFGIVLKKKMVLMKRFWSK